MKEAFKIKDSLVSLLSAASEGRYEVSGFAVRKTGVESILQRPRVIVTYKSGRFPENLSSVNGPYQHEISFEVEIMAAAVSEIDLSPIENGGTPEEIAEAYEGRRDAYEEAHRIIDETAALVFDTIMRPENRELGTGYDAGRWITDYRKSDPADSGDVIFMGGVFTLTARAPEYTTEETGTPGESVHHRIDLTADTNGEFADGETARVVAPFHTGA